MSDASWIGTHTFHHSEFADLQRLSDEKVKKGYTISVCLPTLNEEKTIAKEIVILRSELMQRYPLIDEIVVIDSGSDDKTRTIAQEYGAEVHLASEILPKYGDYRGKGENMWKALYVLKGDIIVYLDADIKNIHHRFAYGLVGPLILRDNIRYVKAFYDRPIVAEAGKLRPTGGGRVTELLIRPLFSLFFPELTQIMQPLSGEYAGFREIFEAVPFPIGYGIETAMLLDINKRWGLDIIGQVDLDKRIHRNQDTLALGRMSFGILKTFFARAQELGLVELEGKMFDKMIQYHLSDNQYVARQFETPSWERPPMLTIEEYSQKFGKKPNKS
ncbi:MAG: glucosyl-3-phosphoglycerate synthase [Elusimicrobia bacterium RIFOXYB2_FULL_49_7]|nr:MAG: glucosyl-3-phosphoglycerate synthase [Elusimicrobia bacterium RIFOXYB2_FULL_49_7]